MLPWVMLIVFGTLLLRRLWEMLRAGETVPTVWHLLDMLVSIFFVVWALMVLCGKVGD